MSTPRSAALAVENRPDVDPDFLADVSLGLGATPKHLNPRWLYDELGSSLFEAICRLPWYRITRAELALLRRHASDIVTGLGRTPTIIELGPGSGEKLACIVREAVDRGIRPDVHLVDVSGQALDMARQTLGTFPGVEPVLHEAPYGSGLERAAAAPRRGRRLVAFLGSNLGNFDPAQALDLVREIARALSPGDQLLLGLDLVKPEKDLLRAYADPLGVTAAFNKNLLQRINRELGGAFDLDRFAHQARWNAAASRVEMHLVSLVRQHAHISAPSLTVRFERGETIWTESSYKFAPGDVPVLGRAAGFAVIRQWIDRDAAFALTLLERAE
jgi:L-histidine Nalpha-methyltransferase